MSTLRETTPPLFFHLISEIAQKGVNDNNFLTDSVLQIEKISYSVTMISTIMNNATNETGKLDLFLLLIRVLASKDELDDDFTDDLIIQLSSTSAMFPIIIKTHDTYKMLQTALSNMYKKLSDTGIRNLQTNVYFTNSPYVAFVFAVLAIEHDIRMPAILGPQNIPTYEALALFFNTHQLSDLDEADRAYLSKYNVPQLIKDLITAFSDSTKVYGAKLLLAYFNFSPAEAQNICPSLDTILGYSKKDLLRCQSVRLLSKLDIGENKVKVFQTLSSQISSNDDFAQAVVEYAKTIDGVDEIIPGLLKSDSTVFGGCLIAHGKGLFESNPDLVNVAFPNPVKRMKIAIGLAKTIQNPPEKLFEALLNQAFVAYANKETDGINSFVLLSKVHPECFANFLLKRLVEITDKNVLLTLSESILNAKLSPIAPSDNSLYYKIICHLYTFCDSPELAIHILSLFKEIDLSDEVKQNLSPIQFLNAVIEKDEEKSFYGTAKECIKLYPYAAALCVAISDLDNNDVESIIEAVQNDDVYSYDLGVLFFTTLAENYLERFLDFLEREQIGKKITNNIFVARKKRVRFSDTVRSVLKILPVALKDKEFNKDEQTRLYAILNSVIPRVNDTDYITEIRGLRPVIQMLKDATPTEEQYNTFIDCGFMEEFPVIFANVEGSEDLARRLIGYYRMALNRADLGTDNIEAVANTLYKLDPTEPTLFFAFELVKKQLSPKSIETDSLRFVTFIQKFAEAAQSHGVKVQSPRFAGFLLRYFNFLTSMNPDYRFASFSGIKAMFDLQETFPDIKDDLTFEQVCERALSLLTEVQNVLSLDMINAIFNIVISKKAYRNSTILLIRALFESRESFASPVYSKNILKVFLAQPSMSLFAQFQLDKGVVALFHRSLIEFIGIILVSESPYQKKVVKMILMDPQLRELFIDTTFIYIIKSSYVERSLRLFYILRQIIISEPNILTPKTLGMAVSTIILWLGALYDQQSSLNLIQSFNIAGEISKVIDIITSRTCLARKAKLSLSTQDTTRFAASLKSFAEVISPLTADELEVIFNSYITKIFDSPNASYIFSAALFIVSFAQSFVHKNSLTQTLNNEILPQAVVKAFQGCNTENVCALAANIDAVQLLENGFGESEQESKSLINDVYKEVVEGISYSSKYVEGAATFLAIFSEVINEADLLPEILLNALRNIFNVCPSNSHRREHLKLLKHLLQVRCDINDFKLVVKQPKEEQTEQHDEEQNQEEQAEDAEKQVVQPPANESLNFKTLVMLIPEFKEDVLEILQKIMGSDDIINSIASNNALTNEDLIDLGNYIIKQTKAETASIEIVKLLDDIRKQVKELEGANSFNNSLLNRLIAIGETNQGEVQKMAADIVNSIINE